MNIFKSPILWGIVGLAITILGYTYSDKDKYPVFSKFSGIMQVAGLLTVGFVTASIIRWNPLTKLNVG